MADTPTVSAVPGFVAGTPLAGSGRIRHPLRDVQNNQRVNPDYFSGAGLSSRLKIGQAPMAPGSFVSANTPQGKSCPRWSLQSLLLTLPLVARRPGVIGTEYNPPL